MSEKSNNINNSTKHLEKAMFENRVASPNDCTGYMPVHTDSIIKSDNISHLMNVPTSKHTASKKSSKKH